MPRRHPITSLPQQVAIAHRNSWMVGPSPTMTGREAAAYRASGSTELRWSQSGAPIECRRGFIAGVSHARRTVGRCAKRLGGACAVERGDLPRGDRARLFRLRLFAAQHHGDRADPAGEADRAVDLPAGDRGLHQPHPRHLARDPLALAHLADGRLCHRPAGRRLCADPCAGSAGADRARHLRDRHRHPDAARLSPGKDAGAAGQHRDRRRLGRAERRVRDRRAAGRPVLFLDAGRRRDRPRLDHLFLPVHRPAGRRLFRDPRGHRDGAELRPGRPCGCRRCWSACGSARTASGA